MSNSWKTFLRLKLNNEYSMRKHIRTHQVYTYEFFRISIYVHILDTGCLLFFLNFYRISRRI